MRVVAAAAAVAAAAGHPHSHTAFPPPPPGPPGSEWTVTTLAGSGAKWLEDVKACTSKSPENYKDGAAHSAKFAAPTRAQVVDGVLYVMDSMNGCIRSIKDGVVSSETPCCTSDITTGSDGEGPQDMHVTKDYFYMMDSYSNLLLRSPRPFTKWTVLAGNGSRPSKGYSTDGPALQQAINEPHGMAVTDDGSGDVYISQTWSSCISLLRNGVLTTIAGKCGFGGYADGEPLQSRFQHMHHINLDPRDPTALYVSDVPCYDEDYDDSPDDQKYKPCAKTNGGVCFSGIRKIHLDRKTGLAVNVTTIVGQAGNDDKCDTFKDGTAATASFNYIHGTAFLPLNSNEAALRDTGAALGGSDTIYVCDEDSNRIRKVDLTTNTVTTLAGNDKGDYGFKDGAGSQATFGWPGGIGLGLDGKIYVGDYESHRIRVVTPPNASATM